jgi:hypothetical protein
MADVHSFSTTDAANNSPPPDGAPEGQKAGTLNNCIRAVMGGIARLYQDWRGSLTTAGTSTAYTLALNQGGIAEWADGLAFRARIHTTAGATPTLNPTPSGGSALGAKSLYWPDGTQVTTGHLLEDGVYDFVYKSGADRVYVLGAPVIAQATESGAGAVELATPAEAIAGTDTDRAVTAKGVAVAASRGWAMQNGILAASVAANALTIAVKTLAGADPSASDPVVITFRHGTIGNGGVETLTLTAATSLVISSDSTLGAASGAPFRLWIVGFNDGGTFRLGVINCKTATGIVPLNEVALASATAEGGAGGADTAGIFYAGATVTTKSYRILGFMTWDSGLVTAGAWAAAPTVIQPFGPGVKKPGDILQFQQTFKTDTETIAITTGAFSDISGLSVALTVQSPANICIVGYGVSLGAANSARSLWVRPLRGSTAFYQGNAAGDRTRVGTPAFLPANSTAWMASVAATVIDPTPGGGSVTYKMQLSADDSDNFYVNRSHDDTDNASHGRAASNISVSEIMG